MAVLSAAAAAITGTFFTVLSLFLPVSPSQLPIPAATCAERRANGGERNEKGDKCTQTGMPMDRSPRANLRSKSQ